MFSAPAIQTQPASRPGRKSRSPGVGEESGKKPKKPNSEIRKQQNRIASRNYREKRKRKLQYLQQLLKDGSSSEQTAQDSEQGDGSPIMSPEYHAPVPAAATLSLPSNNGFSTLASSPVLATTAAYDSHLLATSQPFSTFEPAWHTSIYEPTPAINISSWNVPAWMPGLDFTPPVTSRPEEFQFTPPHSHHSFEQLPTPPRQPHEPAHRSDLFLMDSYGHCGRVDVHSRPVSPYHHPRYHRAP